MIVGTTKNNPDFSWEGYDLSNYGFTNVKMMMIQGRSLLTATPGRIFNLLGLTEMYFPSMNTDELKTIHADLGIGRDGIGNSQ